MKINTNQDISKVQTNTPSLTSTVKKKEEDSCKAYQDKTSLGSTTEEKPMPGFKIPPALKQVGQQVKGQVMQTVMEAATTGDYGKLVKLIEQLAGEIMSNPEAEAELIQIIAGLNATGQIKPTLHALADSAEESGLLPEMSLEQRSEYINLLAGAIDSEFRNRGMTPDTAGRVYQSWEDMGKEHMQLVRNSKIPPRGPGEMSAFTEPEFLKEMESLQNAPFVSGNKITPLINGPASFAKRDELIDNAKESIHFMTWAIYNDETGWDIVQKLAAKHSEGVDVKVVVDGQIGSQIQYQKPLAYLEEQGVPLVRWRDSDEPYNGQHRKMMIVDGKAAIAGGMNPGNVYSHRGDPKEKWRDVDILIEGPAVADCERLFGKVAGKEIDPVTPEPAGRGRSAVVNHYPGEGSNIMLSKLKAIQGASESIDIENAYFIQTPGIKEALTDALDRGVKVRLLTNSAESVDMKVITAPILKSLPDLVDKGAEIYLKQGDTLHSKYMVVDGMFSSVGSYNLHPRSERYEGEVMINSVDTEIAGKLTRSFEEEIGQSRAIKQSDEIEIPENILSMIATRYFFDHL